VDDTVGKLLRRFEDCIRRYPDQWHVLEPIWPAPVPTTAGAAATSASVQVLSSALDQPAEEVKVG
jgi:hypothetical protein